MEWGRQENTGVNIEMGGLEAGEEKVWLLFLYINILSKLELLGINYKCIRIALVSQEEARFIVFQIDP